MEFPCARRRKRKFKKKKEKGFFSKALFFKEF